jgi:hypothetical protein
MTTRTKDPDSEALCALSAETTPDSEALHALSSETSKTNSKWMILNLDTGAARTVFPEDYGERVVGDKYDEETMTFRTATGELVPSKGGMRYFGKDEYGEGVNVRGTLAPVHKPLMSAGQLTEKGNDVYLFEDKGYILKRGSKFRDILRKAFKDAAAKNDFEGCYEVHKERNIYNFYMLVSEKATTTTTTRHNAHELCPHEVAGDQRPGSGFGRQGRSL